MKKWQKKVALVSCSICLILAICVGVASFLVFLRGDSMLSVGDFEKTKRAWIECNVPYAGGTPKLTFMQKTINPPIAEYKYKLRFGSGPDAVERWLPLNCGGRTCMNAYWYPSDGTLGPSVRLQDRSGEYLVRIQEQKTFLLLRYNGRVFAGEITNPNPGSSISETYSIRGEPEIHVSVGGKSAEDITNTNVGRRAGKYFGRIDGQLHPIRFVPVTEAPEMKIEMR